MSAESELPGEPTECLDGLEARLGSFELGPDDAGVLERLRPLAHTAAQAAVGGIRSLPGLESLLDLAAQPLAALAAEAWDIVPPPDGRFDQGYVGARLRIGAALQAAPVRLHSYIAATGRFLRLAVRTLLTEVGAPLTALPSVDALVKWILFDLSLVAEGFVGAGSERATDALREHEHGDRMKEDFVTLLVHDLRTAVQSIMLRAEVALRTANNLIGDQREQLEQIERTSREVTRLLQDTLEVSRLEAGELKTGREPVVLRELVDDVIGECETVAANARVQLTNALASELPVVRTDPRLLKRMLTNLVLNAVYHSGSPEVRIEGAMEAGAAVLRVIDHGRGIPEEVQGEVFEKFRSGSESPAPRTGLGLYFCRLAAQRLNGRIKLTSRPGLTAFELILPPPPGVAS